MTPARFAIVIPTFQADGWLDETLNSIFSQAGRHAIRLHLQDGGSTDATLQIAERWQALTAGVASPFAGRVEMTIDSERDNGLYDAVQRGFETLDPEPGEIMTWLNADDLLAPGALQSVASCLQELPQVSLCGGRVSMIDADGRVVRVNAPVALSQKLLAAGCYDGRKMPFVMQEGTFWRQELWARVGGLDPSFRLAGDWDLWRRMAAQAEFVTLDVLTAFHRRRPGQLSGNLDAYYAEVDRRLTGAVRDAYDRVYLDYIASGTRSGGQAFEGFEGPVAQLDRDSLLWSMTHRFGERLSPPTVQSRDGRETLRRGGVISGARGFEGPYPEWDLPGGIRWITERHASLSLPLETTGRHEVRLTFRPGVADLAVTLRAGEEVLLHAVVDPQTPVRDQALAFEVWGTAGEMVIDLETVTPHGDPENRLLVIDLTVVPAPSSPAGQGDGPIIVVTESAQPQGLAATLQTLAEQAPVPRVTVVSSSASDLAASIAEAFRPMVDQHQVGAAASGLLPDAVIEAGERLAPGALAALLGSAGAAHEVDARAQLWPRPAAALTASFSVKGPPRPFSDRPCHLKAAMPDEAPRARIVRVLPDGGARADALGRMIERMDAEVRFWAAADGAAHTAETEVWKPHAVIGGSRGDDDRLSACAAAADAALSHTRRARALARSAFGIPEAAKVEVVAGDDAGQPSQAGIRLIVGHAGAHRKSGDIEIDALAAPELLSWALSAADSLTVSGRTPERLRLAARACGLAESGSAPALNPAPIDDFARALLAVAPAEGLEALRRSLRFRPASPAAVALAAGDGASTQADGSVQIGGAGSAWLLTHGPARLRLRNPAKTPVDVRVVAGDFGQTVTVIDDKAITLPAGDGRPVEVRFQVGDGQARRRLSVRLDDGVARTIGAVLNAVWEAHDGFGVQEPAAPDQGLDAPFRWVEGRLARFGLQNPKAGRRRVTLRLRSLLEHQRVMVRIGGRTVADLAVEGGDIRRPVSVAFETRLAEGWNEVELRFLAEVTTPDRSLSAILEGVGLADARKEAAPVQTGWRDVDGYDFEEPPAPQFGLETAFRWRLPGARIAVSGEDPGRYRVTLRYRTALPGQTLIASARGAELARHTAVDGRLDTDLILSFEVDLKDRPLEIALDVDQHMPGERPLGFIIQSVSVDRTI